MAIILGDEVVDRVSGFRGVAVSRHTYLYGCGRVTVQPFVKDDILPQPETFDESALEVVQDYKAPSTPTIVATLGPGVVGWP